MKRALLVAVFAALVAACGTGFPTTCCFPKVQPNFGYVGSYATDGGTTQVQLIRNSSGEVELTLIRDGNAFKQTFQSVEDF